MNKNLGWPVLLMGLGLMAVSGSQWLFFQGTLKTWEDQSARMVYQSVRPLLIHAHRTDDDLKLQDVVQGFSGVPGVLLACVVDSDNKIIAHTQPARLGKSFTKPRQAQIVIKSYPLAEARAPGGRFVLELSSRRSRMKLVKEAVLLAVLNLCAWGSGVWLWMRYRYIQSQHRKQCGTLEFRCCELEQNLQRLRELEAADRARWAFWLQRALERIPRPACFLDSTQRLVACNPAAQDLLGLGDAQKWQCLSWQDLPALSACGHALQRSLDRPGESTPATLSGAPVEILSEQAQGGSWILFN